METKKKRIASLFYLFPLLVRRMRFELTHRYRHYPLKVACLPISPPAHFMKGVPRTGLEPACLSTHAPETCASTNSATWAYSSIAGKTSVHSFHFLLYLFLRVFYEATVIGGVTRLQKESGRRNSNPRPQPWQGCALPTELLPLMFFSSLSLD